MNKYSIAMTLIERFSEILQKDKILVLWALEKNGIITHEELLQMKESLNGN